MVGLGPPFPHGSTPIPHAGQNDDITGDTSESHCGAPTVGLTDTPLNDNVTLPRADLSSKELVAVPYPHETEALTPVSINAGAQCSTHEHTPAEAVRSRPDDNCNKVSPSCGHADSFRPPVSGENGAPHSSFVKEKDASPPKRAKYSKVHPYAIISLFDGVGSAIPAITKAIGCAPRIIIVAECVIQSLDNSLGNNLVFARMVNGPKPARTLTRSMQTMCGSLFAINVKYLRKHLH